VTTPTPHQHPEPWTPARLEAWLTELHPIERRAVATLAAAGIHLTPLPEENTR
jgi:hypothetical protein